MKEYLTPIAPTLENANYIIPELIYKVQVNISPKFGTLMPILMQVPNHNDVRIIGAPSVNQRSVCDGESGGNGRTHQLAERFDLLRPICRTRNGIRIHGGSKPSHSEGCVLITNRRKYQDFVRTLLAEQETAAPIYLEICAPAPCKNL